MSFLLSGGGGVVRWEVGSEGIRGGRTTWDDEKDKNIASTP